MGEPGHISVAAPLPLLPKAIQIATLNARAIQTDGLVGPHSFHLAVANVAGCQSRPLRRRRNADRSFEFLAFGHGLGAFDGFLLPGDQL